MVAIQKSQNSSGMLFGYFDSLFVLHILKYQRKLVGRLLLSWAPHPLE